MTLAKQWTATEADFHIWKRLCTGGELEEEDEEKKEDLLPHIILSDENEDDDDDGASTGSGSEGPPVSGGW